MNTEKLKSIIKSALIEDFGPESEGSQFEAGKKDITTETIIGDIKVKAVIISKNEGVIAGLDIANTAFQLVSKNTKFKKLVKDGDKVEVNANRGIIRKI